MPTENDLHMRKRTCAALVKRCFFHGHSNKMGVKVLAVGKCSVPPLFPLVNWILSSPSLRYSVIAMALFFVDSRAFLLGYLGAFASGLLLPSDILLLKPSTIPSFSSGELQLSPSYVSVSEPGFQSNLTFLNDVSTKDAKAKPVCDGAMFGKNLQKTSCGDAIRFLAPETTSMSFGDRGHGFNVQLPRRYSSCK